MIQGFACSVCGKVIYAHIILSDGICGECRGIMEKTKHFEGDEFRIVTKIESKGCFSSRIHTITDYEGYKRVVDLLEELDPPKQSTD